MQLGIPKQEVHRQNKRIWSIKEFTKALKERQYIEDDQQQLLDHTFGGMTKHILKIKFRMKNLPVGMEINTAVRSNNLWWLFTTTYKEWLYKILALLHASSIWAWEASVECDTLLMPSKRLGKERDHLSALLQEGIRNYVSIRLQTYEKKYSEMINL